jgi:hypothetical protein
MPTRSADYYRSEASRARSDSEVAIDPDAKRTLLEIARNYDHLADMVETRDRLKRIG